MIEEYISFYSDEFKLEGILSYDDYENNGTFDNEAKSDSKPVVSIPQSVLLCSPHPHLGGDMDNNVISALAEVLTKNGFITLRFNYRGVGESESNLADISQKFEYWGKTMDSEDYGDFVTDVNAALDFLIKAVENGNSIDKPLPKPVFFVGYSFGAILSMKAGFNNENVKSVVCISTPFGKYDLSAAEKSEKPKFFICSDNDFAASCDEARESFKKFAEPKIMEIVYDCDHFYRGKERLIAEKVAYYLRGMS